LCPKCIQKRDVVWENIKIIPSVPFYINRYKQCNKAAKIQHSAHDYNVVVNSDSWWHMHSNWPPVQESYNVGSLPSEDRIE
jgi:hypothetical protein